MGICAFSPSNLLLIFENKFLSTDIIKDKSRERESKLGLPFSISRYNMTNSLILELPWTCCTKEHLNLTKQVHWSFYALWRQQESHNP